MAQVAVDASLVLLWLLRQDWSLRADALLGQWRRDEVDLVAPPLLQAEVPSVLREAVYHRRLTDEDGDAAFQNFLDMGITILQPSELLRRAWTLGRAVNAPRLYDLHYLALARIQGCPLWTADRRMQRLAASQPVEVRWVGEVADGG